MTPDDAVALLSGDWPPPGIEHWPPRDKARWRKGMHLQGPIEAVLHLPRPDGSKHRGEPYLALYVRRLDNGRLVMWHGWHTAAEDVPGMEPAPGLLFTAVYRGQGANDFEDFKYLITPHDQPSPPGPSFSARAESDPAPVLTAEQVKAAQREATATRNGHATPPAQPERPEPGTAARQAALADAYDPAGIPTPEAIAAVRNRDDGQALVNGAGGPFKQAVKQQGARRPPHGAGVWGAMWNSTDDDLWRRVLTATREALAQPAEA